MKSIQISKGGGGGGVEVTNVTRNPANMIKTFP